MIYSRNGNINTRTGMGTYTYGSASKPHAVTAVDNTSGDIDYNSQDVSYNNWNRVSSVWQYYDDDCYGYSIEYGPDLKRVRSQFHTYNNLIYDMFYWDDYEEKTVGTDTLKYYYLYTSGELDALHIIKSGPSGVSTHTTKVITDHLGSITGLADNYYMAYLANFDAWGGREVYIPYWFDGTFNRGYTGHEHIDELGLVNMNGRMYDPRLGRFLSPDPFVQAPSNPQNYNRYSYCLNNPLKYTDPEGDLCVFVGCLVAAFVSAIFDYGIQVAFNYSCGLSGKDAWVNKVDFFDVGISGIMGAFTAGFAGAANAGKNLGTFGKYVLSHSNLFKYGEIALTSTFDITGEGVQKISFDQVVNRILIGCITSSVSEAISDWVKAKPIIDDTHYELAPNDGAFPGSEQEILLETGQLLDRFGETSNTSKYLAPVGTGIPQRALPPVPSLEVNKTPSLHRNVYVVKRPFNVTSSVVLPWYGQPGMGTQIKTPIPINDLVKQGFLKKIK